LKPPGTRPGAVYQAFDANHSQIVIAKVFGREHRVAAEKEWAMNAAIRAQSNVDTRTVTAYRKVESSAGDLVLLFDQLMFGSLEGWMIGGGAPEPVLALFVRQIVCTALPRLGELKLSHCDITVCRA
jgi:hypothetical protein